MTTQGYPTCNLSHIPNSQWTIYKTSLDQIQRYTGSSTIKTSIHNFVLVSISQLAVQNFNNYLFSILVAQQILVCMQLTSCCIVHPLAAGNVWSLVPPSIWRAEWPTEEIQQKWPWCCTIHLRKTLKNNLLHAVRLQFHL